MEIKNFVITKRDGSKDSFSLDKIMNAIVKAFESVDVPAELGTVSKILKHIELTEYTQPEDIQEQIQSALVKVDYVCKTGIHTKEKYDHRHDNPGRPRTKQLCKRLLDRQTCQLFSKVHKMLNRYIDNPTQYITCFFQALFSLLGTETPQGKIKHYWEMLHKYIKGFRIPKLRAIQEAIRMFSLWQNKTMTWLFKASQEIKYRAWASLQGMIEEILPKLEPCLAVGAC